MYPACPAARPPAACLFCRWHRRVPGGCVWVWVWVWVCVCGGGRCWPGGLPGRSSTCQPASLPLPLAGKRYVVESLPAEEGMSRAGAPPAVPAGLLQPATAPCCGLLQPDMDHCCPATCVPATLCKRPVPPPHPRAAMTQAVMGAIDDQRARLAAHARELLGPLRLQWEQHFSVLLAGGEVRTPACTHQGGGVCV